MRCLVCGEVMDSGLGWDHIRSVHLAPLNLTQEMILAHAQKIAQPLEIKTAYITCLKLPEKIIYFSLDNAELLIAYANEKNQIPWTDIVEWQILHEKGHLTLGGLYEPPPGVRPAIIQNAEDYYINRYLIPENYWPVCLANARCATAIRNLAPVPSRLRDSYFYLTLATFLAYEAVTFPDIIFLQSWEARYVDLISNLFRKIQNSKDISLVSKKIEGVFSGAFHPSRS